MASKLSAILKQKGFIKSLLIIVIGLIYIISPIDLIPDITPIVGWLDDFVALIFTVQSVLKLFRRNRKSDDVKNT